MLNALLKGGEIRLMIDLTRVTYLDSAMLHVLMEVRQRLQHRRGAFLVVVPRSPIRRVFEITGVGRILGIRSNRRQCVQQMRSAPPARQ